jgi:Ca-activated chloride channel homolog
MRFALLLLTGFLLTASAVSDARKANEAFERGEYETAAQLYRQAIEQNPDDARLWFNLGNALARMGSADEAADAYEEFKNRASDRQLRSMGDYNKGRLLSDREEYEEALNHFREALRNNPDDDDARHNFELAQRRQQQQEQDQQQQQQEPDPEQGEDEQDGDQGQDQDQDQDQQGDQDQQSGQQPPGDEQDDQQDSSELPSPVEMTREEAENLLDALEQLERELLENRKKESTQDRPRNERDW